MGQEESRNNDRSNVTWISWEKQRRSLNLSKLIDARTHIIINAGPRLVRHLRSGVATLSILRNEKPKVLFVQNPSRILTLIACLWRSIGGYFLVVDRHSNFYYKTGLNAQSPAKVDLSPNLIQRGLIAWALGIIDRYTLRIADLTIVTNKTLADSISDIGGHPFILPDPFPSEALRDNSLQHDQNNGIITIFFVCSWAPDEPIDFVIRTLTQISNFAKLVVSGKPKQHILDRLGTIPENVRLTGYLSDAEYFQQMANSDIVLVLTTRPATLVCGAYEAIACGKPLILSNSYELRCYFEDSAIYTDHQPESLINAINQIRNNRQEVVAKVNRFFDTKSVEWNSEFNRLKDTYEKHL